MKHEFRAMILAVCIVIAVVECAVFIIKAHATGNPMWTLACLPVIFAASLVWQWFFYKN